MYITKKFVESAGGPRSAAVRQAMVQAGDKHRVEALKMFLISVGCCEITRGDIESLGLSAREKKYRFCAAPLVYVLLDAETFSRFKPLTNDIDLEAAHIRNGVIGIKRSAADD
ncbi:MAG: hypothetical protein LBS53_15215 [Synergistaceae bacterium]|jgi:hypothetical protein|nr:hypothetical protein [Synergistaceae bacterium]